MLHIIPEWLELVLLTFCIGTVSCRLWVLDEETAQGPSSGHGRGTRSWRLFGIGAAAMIACSTGDLMVRAVEMSGRPLSSVYPVLSTVVFHTHLGHAWLIRIGALLSLLILLRGARRYREARPFLFSLLVLLGVIAMTKSASGHSADLGDFNLHEIMDWLHLVAVSVWGGGLLVLASSSPKAFSSIRILAGVAGRFSRIAGIAIAVIAITACYNAWSFVGSIDALQAAPYGWTVLAKIVLFLVIVSIGAFNRYIGIPLLQQSDGAAPVSRISGRFLRLAAPGPVDELFFSTVRVEAFLLLAVLLCSALLRHQVPARHFSHLQHQNKSAGHQGRHEAGNGSAISVLLQPTPADVSAGLPVNFTVRIKDGEGKPLQGLLTHHERILHAIIIGRNLNFYGHVHPEDTAPITDEMVRSAAFPLRFTFPEGGEYLVGLDFATREGIYSRSSLIRVAGEPKMGAPVVAPSAEKDFGEYQVSLKPTPETIRPGSPTTLRFLITRNGKAVTDLEPYLGAPMHLAIVRSDLTGFQHVHGTVPGHAHAPDDGEASGRFGPEIDAEIAFPSKGDYRIFSEVKHQGKVRLFDFTVQVR